MPKSKYRGTRRYMGKLITTAYNEKTDKFTYTIDRQGTSGAILKGDTIRVPIWNQRKKRDVYKRIKL